MTKQEKINDFLTKTAKKHKCTIEEAKEFQISKNYIAYMEKEGRDDIDNNNRNDLSNADNIKCC